MADTQPIVQPKTLASEVGVTIQERTFPTNPKRVVRTYADDVATLTGAPAPVVAPVPQTVVQAPPKPIAPTPPPVSIQPAPAPPPPKPLRPSLSETVAKMSASEPIIEAPHLPQLTKKNLPVPTKPPIQLAATEATTPREWEGPATRKKLSFTSKLFAFIFGMPTTTPPVQQSYIPVTAPVWQKPRAPEAVEVFAPTFKPPEEAKNDVEEREVVLARLRTKVDTYKKQNLPPPPVFPAPKPEAVPVYTPPPAPIQKLAPVVAVQEPERLRTYTDDFSNKLNRQQSSGFSVYAAQADAGGALQPQSVEAPKQNLGLAYMLGGAALFIGGSLLLYYSYTFFTGTQPISIITNAPPTLIAGDESATISGQGGSLVTALRDAENTATPIGTVRVLYLAVSATSTVGGGTLIKALNLSTPDILLRNIGDNSTVGVVHAGDETRVFFVLAATSYERTFAGMLSWEATMGSDFAPLYPPYPQTAMVIGTTTASTTQPLPPPLVPAGIGRAHFVDEVVDSHDVRAYKDANGKTLFLYGYRDQNTLVIARDETAFSVLLARLSATRTQ